MGLSTGGAACMAVIGVVLALSWLLACLPVLVRCRGGVSSSSSSSPAERAPLLASATRVAGANTRGPTAGTSGGSINGPSSSVEVKVSRLRFWALFVYCLGSFWQNVLWIQFSTIVPQTQAYFHVSTHAVNFLVVLGGICYVPVSFAVAPLLARFGMWRVLVGNTFLLLVAGAVRLLARPDSFYWVVVGQTLNAIAGPAIGNIFTLLSAQWFPPEERTTASAVGLGAQGLGCGAGWVLGSLIMKNPSDMPTLLLVEAAGGVAVFFCSLTFPQAPATAPSLSAASKKESFWDGNMLLLRNKSFVLLAFLWTFQCAINVSWQTLIDEFLQVPTGHFSIDQVGAIGTVLNLAGMVGGVLWASCVDRLHVPLKKMLIVLYLICAGCTLYL